MFIFRSEKQNITQTFNVYSMRRGGRDSIKLSMQSDIPCNVLDSVDLNNKPPTTTTIDLRVARNDLLIKLLQPAHTYQTKLAIAC